MFLASASTELKVYNCEKWNVQYTFGENVAPVKDIKWCYDAKYMLQVNDEAQILCITDDKIRNVQDIIVEEPTCGAFYRDSARHLAVGTVSGKTHIWDTKLNKSIKTFSSLIQPVKLLDLNYKNTILATALENGETILYSVGTNTLLSTVKVPSSNSISSLAFHREFRSVLGLATDEGSILIKDLSVNKDKMFLKTAHSAPVTGISFSPINKDVIASCGLDKNTNVYDIRLQTTVSTIACDMFLSCVDISSESYIGMGTKSGQVLVYDLRNYRKPLQTLKDHNSIVYHIAFQPFIPKNKKIAAFNISTKEVKSPKKLKAQKSPDSANTSDLMEHLVSPLSKCLPLSPIINPNDTNVSQDSFLAKIIDQTSHSINDMKPEDFLKLKLQNLNLQSPLMQNKENIASTSTPVDNINGKINRVNQNDTNCSSILQNNEYDVNGNSNDVPDSQSTINTLKLSPNIITDVAKDLKEYIKYTMHDILTDSRNYYLSLTMEQVKNRMFLEEQLGLLNKQIQGLQQQMQIISEENKKLLIEIEILRTAQKL